MGRHIVVIDVGVPQFQNNQVLDPVLAAKFPGASVWPLFRNMAEDRGWEVMTADVFLSRPQLFDLAVCISNECSPLVKELIKRGVKPVVLLSGESPNVAWTFYHELNSRSRAFAHAVVFRAFHSRVASQTQPHCYYWGNNLSLRRSGSQWAERRLLCMVASCKQQVGTNYSRWSSRVAYLPRWVRVKLLKLIDPMLRFADLYELRMAAAEAYAERPDFRLYGRGWGDARIHWRRVSRIRFWHEPVECEDKIRTLANFRFALCFENCACPGYLTEKIFDAFMAGCVPIYMGAPDIEDFVPPGSFIHFRDFGSWDTLWQHLVSMTYEDWNGYRCAIDEYLDSEAFVPFKQETVASTLLDMTCVCK